MSELITDYVTPQELTGYVRAALADRPENQPSLDRWLPNRTINNLMFSFNKGASGLTEAATYRSYNAESPVGAREGVSKVTGKLPPLARKMMLDEFDQLQMRSLPGEIRNLLLRDGVRLARQIEARLELARGDALVNGSVSIEENGVSATVDFARSASHSVTASTSWAQTDTANVLDDLLSWLDVYVDSNGTPPGSIVTSRQVRTLLQRNHQIRKQLNPAGNSDTVTSVDGVNSVLQSFDLPPISTYEVKLQVDGSSKRVIPQDKLLFLPAATDPNNEDGTDLGGTFWGTTLESQEPDYGIEETDQPGIVVGNWKTKDPIMLWTHASAIGLPIMANPDASFIADVIS